MGKKSGLPGPDPWEDRNAIRKVVAVRMEAALIDRVEKWRAAQIKPIGKTEAIRQLVELGLNASARLLKS
jgi:hypothetical protein